MTLAHPNTTVPQRTPAPKADLREEPLVPNHPMRRFVFENVSWDYYTQTLLELDRTGQHARVTYDRGRMEIMTVGRRHEIIKKAIGRLLEAYADESGIGIEGVGNVTCRRADLDRGLEPDECYYVTSVYRGSDDLLDLENNPPPDLAIEVEVSSGIGTRRGIYAEIGVPELWRYDGVHVIVMALDSARSYQPIARSRFFPNLDMMEFSQFVLGAISDQRNVVPEYRKLLRSRKGASNP
jgi:Uma2 family endonuclease